MLRRAVCGEGIQKDIIIAAFGFALENITSISDGHIILAVAKMLPAQLHNLCIYLGNLKPLLCEVAGDRPDSMSNKKYILEKRPARLH
ncbi:hypothetical protein D3C81_2139670 [compost metagenome]